MLSSRSGTLRRSDPRRADFQEQACVLRRLHRYADAAACLDIALLVYPTDAVTLVLKGLALYGDGRGREALEALNTAVEMRPATASFLLARSAAHLLLGDVERAVYGFKEAREVDRYCPILQWVQEMMLDSVQGEKSVVDALDVAMREAPAQLWTGIIERVS